MSAPNYWYVAGSTPGAGSLAAVRQALKSCLLGVSVTITQIISGTGSQTVTVNSTTNIGVGTMLWVNWGASDQECVAVSAFVAGTSVTANFTQTHANSSTLKCGYTTTSGSATWTFVAATGATSNAAYADIYVDATYYSSGTNVNGDSYFVPLIVGHTGTAQTLGFATANDIDLNTYSTAAATTWQGANNTNSVSGFTGSQTVTTAASGTTNYPASGYLSIATTGGVSPAVIAYAAIGGGTTFTNCTNVSGSGLIPTGSAISLVASSVQPRAPANILLNSVLSTTNTLQDAQFSFWMIGSEFGVILISSIGGSYLASGCGSLRTNMSLQNSGVTTITNNPLASSSTSATGANNVSARLQNGQKIMLVNQSHNATSANWANLPNVVTMSGISGTTYTIGATARAFDTGALIGVVTPNWAYNNTITNLDSAGSAYYLTHNTDGTLPASYSTLSANNSYLVIPVAINGSNPMIGTNSQNPGAADIPLYETTSGGFGGLVGFIYGMQNFSKLGSTLDVLLDATGPYVWKQFNGTINAIGLGPLTNTQNTASAIQTAGFGNAPPWVP